MTRPTAVRAGRAGARGRGGRGGKGGGAPPPPAGPPPLVTVEEGKYEGQLEGKLGRVRAQFGGLAGFSSEGLEVFRSEKSHYRMRAEFRVWHEGDELFHIMFHGGTQSRRVRVDNFTVGSRLMNEAMGVVMEGVRASEVLRHKLYQCNYLTTLSGQCLVTMVYHKLLGPEWEAEAEALREKLARAPQAAPEHVPALVGRSRGQKTVLGRDFVVEKMEVGGAERQYRQVEASFSQPNGGMCQHMLNWALDATRGRGGGLLELYCGNGNFCIALAPNFDSVLATELSRVGIAAAKHNLEANSVENVKVAAISAEEFSAAYLDKQPHKKLQKADIDLSEFSFGTVLVDPPRAGLDDLTVKLVSTFDTIVYISCNPDTLHANLEELCNSHDVKRFAVFDQFPYTDHIECGVLLQRRTATEPADAAA